MSRQPNFEGDWYFHPSNFSQEHLQGFRAMVNMTGKVQGLESLFSAAGELEAITGVLAQLKPAFECFQLICGSYARLHDGTAKVRWYSPDVLDAEGDDPSVFLAQLQGTEEETFHFGDARVPGRVPMEQGGEVVVEVGVVDGLLHVFLPEMDTVVMRMGRERFDLDALLQFADESGGAPQKLTTLLLAEEPAHQQQGLELLRVQDDAVYDDWMSLAYDGGSFALVEANYGTLTDAFLTAVFEHPRTDFSTLSELNLSSMPGARLTHLDFLSAAPNLTLLTLSLQGQLRSIEGIGGLEQLRLLDLAHCDGVDVMDALAGCRSLESLELTFCRPGRLEFLRGLTNLRELKMGGIPLQDPDLLSQLTALETLVVGDLSIPDLDFLRPLTKLRFLEFEGIPDGGWSDKSPLAALTQLERLRMPDPADPIFGDTLVFTPQADPDAWRNWLEAD